MVSLLSELMIVGWVIIFVVNVIAMFVYVYLVWGSSLEVLIVFLLASLIGSLLTALYAGYVLWPIGLCLTCLSPITMLLSIGILIANRRKIIKDLQFGHLSHKIYTVCGLFIALLQLSPIIGFFSVSEVCSGVARTKAEPVISALDEYHRDHSEYPEDIDALVPNYLHELPPAVCGRSFYLEQCPSGTAVLAIYTPNGPGIYRYNIETGNWSIIDPLDFNVCDLLD